MQPLPKAQSGNALGTLPDVIASQNCHDDQVYVSSDRKHMFSDNISVATVIISDFAADVKTIRKRFFKKILRHFLFFVNDGFHTIGT